MLSQTNDNPDIRGHSIFSKSYFGQERDILTNILNLSDSFQGVFKDEQETR
jgi:hypothetical protein